MKTVADHEKRPMPESTPRHRATNAGNLETCLAHVAADQFRLPRPPNHHGPREYRQCLRLEVRAHSGDTKCLTRLVQVHLQALAMASRASSGRRPRHPSKRPPRISALLHRESLLDLP